MPGFFPIKKNRKPLLTITDFTEVMQYILGAMYFLSLIKPANGDICFEINNQDYTLSCSRDEGKIFSLLQAGAGAYKDSADDCARYFIEELNFCHGLLAGTVCDLKYHDFNVPDPTAIDIIKANCKDGYGTSADIIITIAIAVGALLVTAITACLLVKACKTRPNQAINEVNEASFILEETPATGDALPTTSAQALSHYGTFRNPDRDSGSINGGVAAEAVVSTVVGAILETAAHSCNIM